MRAVSAQPDWLQLRMPRMSPKITQSLQIVRTIKQSQPSLLRDIRVCGRTRIRPLTRSQSILSYQRRTHLTPLVHTDREKARKPRLDRRPAGLVGLRKPFMMQELGLVPQWLVFQELIISFERDGP